MSMHSVMPDPRRDHVRSTLRTGQWFLFCVPPDAMTMYRVSDLAP